ncbi:ATP-binding protein [Gimesia maris]|uniref:histidine kinase n=1 Tax=Gimesia maris TaxID=122 RepID=A0ABX5YP95_9PLAN|nr:ATP-binding protein [Gimesia maris]EDL60840.1 sensory box histidine kinase [Gimesia maris DSM 8797]QEG17574.1 Phytochrome-like protein cph1 [Gimesia maris]
MTFEQKQHLKTWVYTIAASFCLGIGVLLQHSVYRGSQHLHTTMEVVATMLAFFVAALSLVRFYSKKNNLYLFVSMGFLGVALLDSYHCLVTSSFFQDHFPSPPRSLIPWSWNASRVYLAGFMYLSFWAWKREQKLGKAGQISDRSVLAVTAILTLFSFLFFIFVPLPRAYYPEFFLGRPEELVAGVFFLLALIGYYRKGDWQHDAFEYWIVMSLLIGTICQVVVMSRSFTLFDSMFDLAHIMKIASYSCLLIGLLVGIHNLSSKMQSDIQLVHEQFELLIEESPVAMIMINQEREIIIANPATSNFFGYTKEELLGEKIEKLLPQRYRPQHPQQVASFFKDGKSRHLDVGRDLIGLHGDGHEFPVEIFINYVQTTRSGPAVICSVVDISKWKNAEAENRRQSEELKRSNLALESINSELEQFAYIASHDLQEPLRKVASCCQMLKDDYEDKLDDDGRMWIGYAIEGAVRMRQLVNDLLEFSRIGTLGYDPQPTDAHQACQEALYNLSDSIEQNKAQIICRPLPVVLADKQRLIQLFQNLIGNGIKYCREELTVIEIGAEPDGSQWKFYIKDNGIGIAPEFHERIFQIFQRLHLKNEYSGTGIGLAICKKVVDKSGGKIWLESQVGKGTTFYFTLPAEDRVNKPRPITEVHDQET